MTNEEMQQARAQVRRALEEELRKKDELLAQEKTDYTAALERLRQDHAATVNAITFRWRERRTELLIELDRLNTTPAGGQPGTAADGLGEPVPAE